MKEYFTIKEIHQDNRPMEKLLNYGVDSLSNVELLAILIGSGTKGRNAIDLASHILNGDSKDKFLLYMTVENLMSFKGIALTKATRIKAGLELGKRLGKMDSFDKISLNNPETVAEYLYKYYRDSLKEEFLIILLDTKNKPISVESISIGTINKSIVHPRDVFRQAINRNANSIILAHNHPSGDPSPSNEDLDVTNRLIEAGKLVGINVVDHVIVGSNRYISLREKNLVRGFI